MPSSAVLRRWVSFSTSGVFRSNRISMQRDHCSHSLCKSSSSRQSHAIRMMCTATCSGASSQSAPWLMLPPAVDGSGNIAYRFHSLDNNKQFIYKNKLATAAADEPADIIRDIEFVGSSHGWLALKNRRNCENLLLSNPITDQHVDLPPLPTALGAAKRVILSSPLSLGEEEEEESRCLAFAFGTHRNLAFCSPRRSRKWTVFGSDRVYISIAYSSRHNRLFCATSRWHNPFSCQTPVVLESWEVREGGVARLDWEINHHEEPYLDSSVMCDLESACFQMRYISSAENSGDVFLVVRHVNLRAGPYGSFVDRIRLSLHRGCHFMKTPYKTMDFQVYKIDFKRGELVEMKDSLQGLAMFVGINHSFAIPAAEVAGVWPDCVYFTDENELVEPTRLERTSYGGHDNGIFDYRNKVFHSCCEFYPIEYEKIRKILPLPLWFRY